MNVRNGIGIAGAIAAAAGLWLASGCKKGEEKTPQLAPPPPPAQAVKPAAPAAPATNPYANQPPLQRAQAAVMLLGKTLRERLQAELPKGPAAAIEVCAKEASSLTAKVAKETNVRLGRSSLKLRNRRNAPLPWVQDWLNANEGKAAKDAAPIDREETTPEGKVARVLRPIAVDGVCLTCHGPADKLAPAVKKVLAQRYEDDAATGYAEGELRGAIWAEADILTK